MGGNMKLRTTMLAVALSLTCAAAPVAVAQTIKIGIINTYSGPEANSGDQLDKGFKLYLKLNSDKLPPGVKIETIFRDDTGPNPDMAKRLAQELIVREKVHFLTGLIWTPNAAAIAPLTAEAKVPLVISNAAGSAILGISPYMVRTSFTLWQSAYPLGQWAAKRYQRAYTAVTDFVPGHEAEEAFTKGFKDGGGEILGSVRIPLANPDFVPFMQRVKDTKPEVLFSFNPGGKQATAQMKAYADLGLAKAGIKYIGTGDIVTDMELPNMGEVPLGVVTAHHYSANADRPANKAFVAAYKKEYGEKLNPSFIAVGGWDSMDAIFYAIREQKGKVDPDKTMELLKRYKNPNSPRGPISIDPETRDIIQNEYIREARRVGGQIMNVELETIPNVKDPWKEFNKKK